MTPEEKLIAACREGNLREIRRMIQRGINVHIEREMALRISCVEGNLDAVKLLVELGADIHYEDDLLLFLVNMCNHYQIIKYILSLESRTYWLTHNRKSVRDIHKKYKEEYALEYRRT